MDKLQLSPSVSTEYIASRSLLITALSAKVCSFVSVSTRFPRTNSAVSPALNTGFSLSASSPDLPCLSSLPPLFSPAAVVCVCGGVFSCWGWGLTMGKYPLFPSLKYPMANSRKVVGSTVPTRSAWAESTFSMARLLVESTSAALSSTALACPSHAARRQSLERYSSRMKKSSASNTSVSVAFSPKRMRLQKTSLGYQPVFALISSNACATVFPRLTSCTDLEESPCLDGCGTAICEVMMNSFSSLSMATAVTMAVFSTSSNPKSLEKNKKTSKTITSKKYRIVFFTWLFCMVHPRFRSLGISLVQGRLLARLSG